MTHALFKDALAHPADVLSASPSGDTTPQALVPVTAPPASAGESPGRPSAPAAGGVGFNPSDPSKWLDQGLDAEATAEGLVRPRGCGHPHMASI